MSEEIKETAGGELSQGEFITFNHLKQLISNVYNCKLFDTFIEYF